MKVSPAYRESIQFARPIEGQAVIGRFSHPNGESRDQAQNGCEPLGAK